jgi:hypothetical protein
MRFSVSTGAISPNYRGSGARPGPPIREDDIEGAFARNAANDG